MPLTEDGLKAIGALFDESLEPLRSEMNYRFREVDVRFGDLYVQNEKREAEYLFMKAQLPRQDERLETMTDQLDRIKKKFDRHALDDSDGTVAALERKSG